MPLAVLVLTSALVCVPAATARAADIRNILVDYTLTSWAQRDGLPSVIIRALAQDRDGYLWLGTDAGPVRFDGARFTTLDAIAASSSLRPESVRSICATRDGSVWFGFAGRGGVARFVNGQVREYGPDDGLPEGVVSLLFEDSSHTVWAHNGTALFRFDGSRWFADGQRLPGQVNGSAMTPSGDFVISTMAGVFRQRKGHGEFDRIYESPDGARDAAIDRVGTLWVADLAVGVKSVPPHVARSWHETGRGNRLLVDSLGNLWVGTLGQGLWRIQPDSATSQPIIEKTTTLAGLSDDGVLSLLEDASGNVWVGTLDGLNRLAPHKMTPVMDLGLVNGVETASDGSAWIVGVDALTLLHASGPNQGRYTERLPGPLVAVDGDGRSTIWLATSSGVFTLANGQKAPVPFPGDRQPRRIASLAADPQGGLWISDLDQGLLRWTTSGVETIALPPSVKESRVAAMETDRDGRLWLAFVNERVAAVDLNRAVHVFGREDGLNIGAYRMLCEDHRGVIWMVGTQGLARFADGRFSTLRRSTGFLAAPLVAILEDDTGSLWIGAERPQSGIARVATAELEKAFADPTYQLQYRFFDKADGVAGTPRATGTRPAVRTPDGHLWFVSGRGMTLIDPRSLPAGPAPPVHVTVDRAIVDGQSVSASSPVELPTGANMLEIDYGIVDVTSQLRTRFRYRLDGFDHDWIDVGARRQAFYTNLPPRTFQFRVSASRDDGSWTDPATVWRFAIQPRFYQTTWFWILCAVALVTIVGASWRIHVRRVRNQFALLLGERARVAREIHDTLLQGLFGVALRCDALSSAFGAQNSLREDFLQMQRDVQGYIDEARQSIHRLRSPRLASGLTDALREAGDRMTAGTPINFELTIRGKPHGSQGEVDHELLRIGQEAIANAVRHANAKRIGVEVRFDRTAVTLRVSDDGCGFDPVEISGGNGHYGLAAMRERVDSIGGQINITSRVGVGSHIEVAVPR